MKRLRHPPIVVVVCLGLSLLSGCIRAAHSESSRGMQVVGAGSTFVYPLMSRWIADYQQKRPGVQIQYQAIGSGGGIQQVRRGLVDFGASDMPLADDQLQQMPPLVQVPEAAAPVCITYNLRGLNQPLKLSAKTLTEIYLGNIKNWHDAAIRSDNKGANFPDQPIFVVHRSDGSGTTNIFTTYLSTANPNWEAKFGRGLAVSWPIGVGGKGSDGVTSLVKRNAGPIGYVEFNYAEQNQLPMALVQNKAGNYVAPTVAATSAAIDAYSSELQKDVRTPIVDPPPSAAHAYPISGLTFLLVPTSIADTSKAARTKAFVRYVIGEGQASNEPLHYSKLPASLLQIDQNLLSQVRDREGN